MNPYTDKLKLLTFLMKFYLLQWIWWYITSHGNASSLLQISATYGFEKHHFYDTQYSRLVTHASTNRVWRYFTSGIQYIYWGMTATGLCNLLNTAYHFFQYRLNDAENFGNLLSKADISRHVDTYQSWHGSPGLTRAYWDFLSRTRHTAWTTYCCNFGRVKAHLIAWSAKENSRARRYRLLVYELRKYFRYHFN